LRRVHSGSIMLMDRDVTHSSPAQRGIGYVPQDRALFHTMTVHEHLAFALVLRKWSNAEIERRVDEVAEQLGIRSLLSRSVQGLSGGEAQRVALGRALSARPQIMVLDEPLSALDDDTREEMIGLLKTIQAQNRLTALHVTHHKDEARALGQTILMVDQLSGAANASPASPASPVTAGGDSENGRARAPVPPLPSGAR